MKKIAFIVTVVLGVLKFLGLVSFSWWFLTVPLLSLLSLKLIGSLLVFLIIFIAGLIVIKYRDKLSIKDRFELESLINKYKNNK